MVSTAPPPSTRTPGPRQGGRPSASPPAGGVTIDPRKLFLQYWPWLIGSAVLGVALGLATHIALLRLMPVFEGSVLFEMQAVITQADQASTTVGQGAEAEIERFIGTQIQVMRSDTVLKQAVTTPQVRGDTKWIKAYLDKGIVNIPEAAKELEDISRARVLPDSNIVVLRVHANNKNDAATLVKAIKDIYMNELRISKQRKSVIMFEPLNDRLNVVREERLLKQERIDRLFTESDLDTLEENLSVEKTEIEKLMPVLVDNQYQLDLLESQLKQYEEARASQGGPIYPEPVVTQVDQNPIIATIRQQIAGLKTSKRASIEQYGPNHRDVRRLEKQIEAASIQLQKEREKRLEESFSNLMDQTQGQVRNMRETGLETAERLSEVRVKLTELNRLREDYQGLSSDVESLAKAEQDLTARIAEQKAILQRSDSTRVTLLQDADPPDRPSFPLWYIIIPVVTVLCTGLTAGAVVLRELLEQRVRGPADLSALPRTRIVGLIPDISEDPSKPGEIESAVRERPGGVVAEYMRQIRGELLQHMVKRGHKSILVIGGLPHTGATATIINLASSFAASQRRVLVIDANFRRPGMHAPFGLTNTSGLGELLIESRRLDEIVQSTETPNLDVLTTGGQSGPVYERLTTSAMRQLIEDASKLYDIILIDTAPATVSSDAFMLANICDATLLIVRAFNEKRGLVERIHKQLDEAQSDFLGVIINAVRASAGGYFRRNFRATHDYQQDGAISDRLTVKGDNELTDRIIETQDSLSADENSSATTSPASENGEANVEDTHSE